MQKEDCFYLGKITKKHGFKGNLIIHLDTDEPELYNNLESVFIEKDGILVPFFFESVQLYSLQKLLIRFEDISPEEAESLIGRDLYLPLSFLPELDGNDFYYHEIVGFLVIDKNFGELGLVKRINDNSPQALLEIEKEDKNILIPIVDEWILEVNREENFILIQTPEGLIDLYLQN